MLFNSFTFLFFFIAVYAIYLSLQKRYRLQNLLLLLGSYVFYGFWDVRFLSLILISTVVDYLVGQALANEGNQHKRKSLLAISLMVNLGLLAFFKYFNFFAENLYALFQTLGITLDPITLNIILPVGISFYTFQTLSYTIDIYRGKLKPSKNFLDFALFVAFFPQLVAGPIERAYRLLPQISLPRKLTLEQIHAGVFLVIWGLFKKIVIADNMALVANEIFNNHSSYSGFDLVVGVLAFSIQIYGDFSGYSDIARGLAKMMGFDLMINFKLPYFAISPSDFWNRWHISLSSWLRDYLYIPLGGNRKGNFNTLRNLSLTMLLGGLWHGASWNFVLWGAFHGLILIIYRLFDNTDPSTIWIGFRQSLNTVFKIGLMFCLTLFGWLLFRAESFEQISYFIRNFGFDLSGTGFNLLTTVLCFSTPLFLIQAWQYRSGDLLVMINKSTVVTIGLYMILFALMIAFGVRSAQEFIYFQF